jgi:hypothetical protein
MGIQLFFNNFFSYQKKFFNKFYFIRNFKNVKKHIPTVFVYCSLSIIYKKITLKNLFLNIFPPLPFTGFTDVTGKFHFFNRFTGKFKSR